MLAFALALAFHGWSFPDKYTDKAVDVWRIFSCQPDVSLVEVWNTFAKHSAPSQAGCLAWLVNSFATTL